MSTIPVLVGHYDYSFVALSIVISVLAAYAALDLAQSVTTAHGGSRLAWLYGGATAMGMGIWASHYVAMLALHLHTPVLYDWPTVLGSLLTAILASGLALWIVGVPVLTLPRAIGGSVVMGCGIAATHYLGIHAMRLRAVRFTSPMLDCLSVLVVIAISFVALQLAFGTRHQEPQWSDRKIGAGLILGAAVPAMHYLTMAADKFAPSQGLSGSLNNAVTITPFGLRVVVLATVVLLLHVFIVSMVNRRFLTQSQLMWDGQLELQTIFDSIGSAIALVDPRRNLIRINRAAAKMLGVAERSFPLDASAKTFAGLEFLERNGEPLAPGDTPGSLALGNTFIENRELMIHLKETGQRIYCEIDTAPILDRSGAIAQVILICRDVTERQHIEEARDRLIAIIESSQDAIIGQDPNGVVTSWNRGAEILYGYRADEMIGQSVHCLLPPGQEHEEDGTLERVRKGETVHLLETSRIRKDGQIIQVSVMISPICDGQSKKIIGSSKIARDVTERKMLERQLRQSQKMEAIGQLTGGIAHDFNNLLAIVIGNLGLMEMMIAGNEQALKRLKPAQKAAARGADLTRRMLALASREDLNPTSVHVEDSIQETIDLAGRALGPEIKIVTQFDKTTPPVFVDAAGLESALLNLSVNARDAMPKGGTLTFDTQLAELDESFPSVQTGELSPGTYARIAVSDTGIGMSKETLERALEPFFTTKSSGKGTGLGLAMVYGFAKQSLGTVRLYSELGYGTTVTLYLPLASGLEAPHQEVPVLRPAVQASGTVLVVDDETELLEIAHAYLTEMGYSALRADNAASALTTLAQYKEINLLVTDIIMPGGMNGVELAEKARQLSPTLKVIYSSGFPADALIERNGTMVDAPLLRKPYQRAEFAAIIQRTMEDTPV